MAAAQPRPRKPAAPVVSSPGLFEGYDHSPFFCELTTERGNGARAVLARIRRGLEEIGLAGLRERSRAISRDLFNLGITFTVYSDREAIDRILPFDVVPRVLTGAEWARIEAGCIQRVEAINLFLADIYGDQKVLADGIVPRDLVLGNPNYTPEMVGLPVRHGAYVNIAGIDIIRGADGAFQVLEDNARTPSGVSYVIENRHMMLRAFPDLMADMPIRHVDVYGNRLRTALEEIAPKGVDDPQIVLLSPGIYNSAYFEHVFLAREMGVPLVEGADLFIEKDKVYMRTTRGPARVHVIYRRVGDDFLDPNVFRPESLLGVRGLVAAWRKGHVSLANAIGTGVADDKAIYAYMPRLIRYYLDQDPILPNVETRICREPDALAYTLDHLEELVVKPVGESGGYGMIIGPHASKRALAEFRRKLKSDPDNYISQPMISLSVCPTLTPRGGLAGRHVDLRPFIVTGRSSWVLPGGLSRVALKPGSLIVNSSQGGGSKDTWVLGT